jgi:hypothetical protein
MNAINTESTGTWYQSSQMSRTELSLAESSSTVSVSLLIR